MIIGSGPKRTPPLNGVDGTPEMTKKKYRDKKKSCATNRNETENRIFEIFLIFMANHIAEEDKLGLDGNVL